MIKVVFRLNRFAVVFFALAFKETEIDPLLQIFHVLRQRFHAGFAWVKIYRLPPVAGVHWLLRFYRIFQSGRLSATDTPAGQREGRILL